MKFFKDFNWSILTTWLIFISTPCGENRCESVIKNGKWELYTPEFVMSEVVNVIEEGEKEFVENLKEKSKIRKEKSIKFIKEIWKINKFQLQQWIHSLQSVKEVKLNEEEYQRKEMLENLFEELLNSYKE